MPAHKGGTAKNIVISPTAEEWGRANEYGDLMDELRRFVALWQASWKLREMERMTRKTVDAAQKRIDEATHKLETERAKLYTEALAELNAVRND